MADQRDSFGYDTGPVYRLLARHRDSPTPVTVEFFSARLEINSGVFNPSLSNASRLLGEATRGVWRGRVLDVFSGSGALGINAALHGCKVVMVDSSEAAVSCSRRNVEMNGVRSSVDVRLGRMADCVAEDETFDVIVANPPLLPGDPVDDLTAAVISPNFAAILDFLHRVSMHLSSEGVCYLVTSDVFLRHGQDVGKICRANGLESAIERTLDVGYEVYSVHRIER
jgi:methylase of polypeptide subunit release factors